MPDVTVVSIGALRSRLADTLRRVREDGEIVTITRHGEAVARIVPFDGPVVHRVSGAQRPGTLKIEAS